MVGRVLAQCAPSPRFRVWGYKPTIPAFRAQEQKSQKFKVSPLKCLRHLMHLSRKSDELSSILGTHAKVKGERRLLQVVL